MRKKSENLEAVKQYGFNTVSEVVEPLGLQARQLGVIRENKPNLFHNAMLGLSLSSGKSKAEIIKALTEQIEKETE